MNVMETRHYEAISRIDAEVKEIRHLIDERYHINSEKFDTLFNKLDILISDVANCPYMNIDKFEKRMDSIEARVDRVMFGVLGAVALLVISEIVMKVV